MTQFIIDRDKSHISLSYSVKTYSTKTRYRIQQILRKFHLVRRSHMYYADLTERQISELKGAIAALIEEHAGRITSLDLFRDGRSIIAYPGDFETSPSQESVG